MSDLKRILRWRLGKHSLRWEVTRELVPDKVVEMVFKRYLDPTTVYCHRAMGGRDYMAILPLLTELSSQEVALRAHRVLWQVANQIRGRL